VTHALADRVAAILTRLCPDGRLGVAVSGGSDSTALLMLAEGWARGSGGSVRAATVDHRLRAASAAEAAAVGAVCARLGVPHSILTWQDGPGPGNLQAQARAARTALLGDWAREAGLSAVALGHTADDQAETVLLRLARGSGVDGLSAMAEDTRRAGMRWLRPLLSERRETLRDWLTARGVAWSDDPSNADPRFDRVRARTALAALAPLGLTAEGLAATASVLARQRRVLEQAAGDLARAARRWGACGEAVLDLGALAGAEEDTRLRVLADTMQRIGGDTYRPRQSALDQLWRALRLGEARTLGGCLIVPEMATDGAPNRATGDGTRDRTRDTAEDTAGASLAESTADDARNPTALGAGARARATVLREPAACAPPVPLTAGRVWDGRWRVAACEGWGPATVGALGADGLATLNAAERRGEWTAPPGWRTAPRAARLTLPALRDADGGLRAAPHAGWRIAGTGDRVLRFEHLASRTKP
jgi:tRNA(Ile)-lysidine synthase